MSRQRGEAIVVNRSERANERRRRAGFTLFELLVVLALLGLVLALVPPLLSRGSAATELRIAAREVAAGLRQARSRAISRNGEIAVVIDVDKRAFRVDGDPRPRLLKGRVDLALLTAESELVNAGTGAIRFYGDGTSTGGRVRITGVKGAREVAVDWLTGQVSIRE